MWPWDTCKQFSHASEGTSTLCTSDRCYPHATLRVKHRNRVCSMRGASLLSCRAHLGCRLLACGALGTLPLTPRSKRIMLTGPIQETGFDTRGPGMCYDSSVHLVLQGAFEFFCESVSARLQVASNVKTRGLSPFSYQRLTQCFAGTSTQMHARDTASAASPHAHQQAIHIVIAASRNSTFRYGSCVAWCMLSLRDAWGCATTERSLSSTNRHGLSARLSIRFLVTCNSTQPPMAMYCVPRLQAGLSARGWAHPNANGRLLSRMKLILFIPSVC
jgi:hypothetical protein